MASEPAEKAIDKSKANAINTLLEFPFNLGAHSIVFVFKKYRFVEAGTFRLIDQFGGTGRSGIFASPLGPVSEGIDVIRLPLPSNIQDLYSIRVQGGELGISGAEVARGVSGFSGDDDITTLNLLTSLRQGLPNVNWESLIKPNLSQASRNLAFAGRRAVDNTIPGGGRAIDTGLGNTINPKAALFFDGVNLKQFDFRWNLAPTERGESDRLKEIIRVIKKNSLPTYGDAIGLNRVLLNYPSTVDIYFQGVDQEHFLFFKTCMVQQFETNYTPNGLAFVASGKPAMVSVGMTLMEMDIHTSEDYDGGARQIAGAVPSPNEDSA